MIKFAFTTKTEYKNKLCCVWEMNNQSDMQYKKNFN